MNGLSSIHYAESVADERARLVERHAAEGVLLAGVIPNHRVRTHLGRGLIKVGMWVAPRPPEPHRRARTIPIC